MMICSMHVLFMREHNRVAKLIGKYLPKNLQQDELIYQVNKLIYHVNKLIYHVNKQTNLSGKQTNILIHMHTDHQYC